MASGERKPLLSGTAGTAGGSVNSSGSSKQEGDKSPFYFLNRPKRGGSVDLSDGSGAINREGERVELANPLTPKKTIMNKPRKVPVKVEPKVFFANERTFIAWMHMGVTLATISIAILAFAEHNEWSQVYGMTMMPVSIGFILYALYQYMKRASMIRRRSPGPYDDVMGPIVLATMLSVAIVLNFAVKMYALYGT